MMVVTIFVVSVLTFGTSCVVRPTDRESSQNADARNDNVMISEGVLGGNQCEERMAQARTISIKQGPKPAVQQYKEIIAAGCDDNNVEMNLGLAYARAGNFEEAAERYRLVISRDQNHWAAHWALAQTLILELRSYEEGLKEVDASRQLDNMDGTGFLYDYFFGRAYEGLQDYDRALVHYRIYEKAQSARNKNEPRLKDVQNRIRILITLQHTAH